MFLLDLSETHLKYCSSRALLPICSLHDLLLTFAFTLGFTSSTSPLFKDRHSCVSGSSSFFFFFETARVIQSCKWNDLCVGVFPRMLGFRSLVQWPPHYVGKGDSREEDGLSEQHPFWGWGTEFSWQIMHCFRSVCPPFPFILCHSSTIANETFVLIISVVHVRMRCFIVLDLVCTTLRPGLNLQIMPNVNDLYNISHTVYSVLFYF